MRQETPDYIEEDIASMELFQKELIAKLTCFDGLCGALDCNRCNPGWYNRKESYDDNNSCEKDEQTGTNGRIV